MAMVWRLRKLRRFWAGAKIHTLPGSDLWAQCARALQRRGWASVTASWIKSHHGPGEMGCPLD
eukprot:12766310-Alexandrium_andersonii.AAC.1